MIFGLGWLLPNPFTNSFTAHSSSSMLRVSPLPQALIQCRQRLTYELRLGKLVIPVVVSTAACGRRLGGGLALGGLFTGLDRAPERTGDSPPRHIPSPTSLRAHHCVPSSVHVRPCTKGPHYPHLKWLRLPDQKWL